jgi:hypothetical protein
MAGQSVNLRPTILNLYLYSGDGFSIKLECKDSAGTPVDLTGSVSAQVRVDRVHPDDPPLASFTVDSVDSYMGIVTLSLTGVQTDALLDNDIEKFIGVWDVEWSPADKEPRTLLQGLVECVADVTR